MAEDTPPSAPRTLGIKPITIKPIQPPVMASDASAVVPEAAKTSAIKPITLAPTDVAGKQLGAASPSATIRLKPVSPAISATQIITPPPQQMRPPTIQPPTIKPSPNPPSEAAKLKTSRISLDAAFGDAVPTAAPVGKITSHLTGELTTSLGQTAKVSLPLETSENEVTRRRTLRVKAPTPTVAPSTGAEKDVDSSSLNEAPTIRKRKPLILKKDSAATSSDAPADAPAEEGQISAFSAFQNQPKEKTHFIFPAIAVAAILMIITLSVLYMSQACGPDRSLTAFSSFPGGPNVGWPGKISSF